MSQQRRGSSKVATWKRARIPGQPFTFHDIKTTGWINEGLRLGRLVNVKVENRRVIFKFELNGRKFDAISFMSNDWAIRNRHILRENHSYVISGTIFAKTRSKTKYERSSDSTGRHTLHLYRIQVVEESLVSANPENMTLETLRRNINEGKYFDERMRNLKITNGEIYRYLGCETCFTSIPVPNSRDNKFYCRQCLVKDGPKNRQMCVMIRNLTVSDSTGSLHGLIIYHHEIVKLCGRPLVEDICRAFTDFKAKQAFRRLLGSTVNGIVVHQRKTGSRTRQYNTSRLILKEIQVVTWNTIASGQNGTSSGVPAVPAHLPQNGQSNGNMPGPSQAANRTATNAVAGVVGDMGQIDEGDEDEPVTYTQHENINELEFLLDENVDPNAAPDVEEAYTLKRSKTGYHGLALVININCDVNQMPRRGSEHDVKVLQDAFPKLSIEIYRGKAIENPRVQQNEFENILQDFKSTLIRNEYSCMFLVFMGHGTQNKVKLGDGERINSYQDIMCKFSEENFPQFAGKPKTIIYGSCQLTLAGDQDEFSVSPTSPMGDFLWITPCMTGQKSKRNPAKGSYFIQALAECMLKYRRLELTKIILKVYYQLKNNPLKDNSYCLPTVSGRGFRAFFFPDPDI